MFHGHVCVCWRCASKTFGSWRRRNLLHRRASNWSVQAPTRWKSAGALCRRQMPTYCSWWSMTCHLPLSSQHRQPCHRLHRHELSLPQHLPLHRDRLLFALQVWPPFAWWGKGSGCHIVCITVNRHSPFSRWPLTRRWCEPQSLWCIVNATPDLKLPSWCRSITALWFDLNMYCPVICIGCLFRATLLECTFSFDSTDSFSFFPHSSCSCIILYLSHEQEYFICC